MPQITQDPEDNGVEIQAETPIGKLAAKGMRISDLIALFTLMAVCIIGWVSWQHETSSVLAQKRFIIAIREAAIAQRLQTCILAQPQEKREQEYLAPNGFCRQMAALTEIQ